MVDSNSQSHSEEQSQRPAVLADPSVPDPSPAPITSTTPSETKPQSAIVEEVAGSLYQKLLWRLQSTPISAKQSLSWQQKVVLWAIAVGVVPVVGVAILNPRLPRDNPALALTVQAGIAAGIAGASAQVLTRRALHPVRSANAALAQMGGLSPLPEGDELQQLETNVYQLSEQLQSLSQQQSRVTQRQQLFSSLNFRVRQSPRMEVLMDALVHGARQYLGCDRLVIYRFNSDWSGTMVAESVADGYARAFNATIADPCFQGRYVDQYRHGRSRAINDVYQEPGLTDCYLNLLEQYQVKANLAIPIRVNDELYGLLIAHHCATPHVWHESEMQFMSQLATEFEYHVEFIQSFQQRELATQRAWLFGEVAFRARQGQDLNDVLKAAVQGARNLLSADRVVIYRFNPDWSGTMIAESVTAGYPSVLTEKIDDPCFRGRYVELYERGRVRAIPNLREEPGLTDCHIRTLEKYGVKANLVAPIRHNAKLMGLLIVHQCAAPRNWHTSEIDFVSELAVQIEYAIEHLEFVERLQATIARSRLLGDVAFRARRSLSEEAILKVAVQGAMRILKTDRVVVYYFNPDWSGTMIAESVVGGYPSVLQEQIEDPCFRGQYVELYRQGRVRAINDIYQEPGLTDCHIRTLEQYEVKANMVAPIRYNQQLYGLLIAHHCAASRVWSKSEIDFFAELALQVEYALEHIRFIGQLEEARTHAEATSDEQRQQKEAMQTQLATLLTDLEGARDGNLTVQVRPMMGDFQAIAQFLNNTIRNLRQLVLQVQASSHNLTRTAHSNEREVSQLSAEAVRQAEALTLALEHIQQMTESIQQVAEAAQAATIKVQQADQALQEGDTAMNRTVDGILAIQETVEETAAQVRRLGESSLKISRVVSLIRELASQTHVLALNASIEAGSSLSGGQGFSVVAGEVRSLAERSTTATREIEQIVEEIQSETNHVVTAMEAGLEQVMTGTRLVQTTRESLRSIATVSGEIRHLVETITQAATAQTRTSKLVSKTMHEVEAIAQATAQQSSTVAAAMTQLLDVAQELQASVTQFKV